MRRKYQQFLIFSSALILLFVVATGSLRAEVIIQPTPDEGLQPRLSVDQDGVVHLLYFKKRLNRPAAREGNLYYRQYDAEHKRFGIPVKVSSQAYNLQMFSIARAAMAVDAEGRIHVLWYLSRDAQYLYTRSNPERTRFEPQRSMVSEFVAGIDAGADIAARGSHVAIVWGAGELSREYERTVFARLSNDNGASFGAELSVGDPDLGACACCSPAADFVDENDLLVAYRSAINGIGRHMQLLTLNGVNEGITGASYGPVHKLQQWELSSCPLSTNDIGADADGLQWLVFETESRIVQLNLGQADQPSAVAEPFTKTRQKNPTVAFNGANERLVAWGEGISHARGGRLNLQLFDASGDPIDFELSGELEIPKYSFPAAASLPNEDFLLLY